MSKREAEADQPIPPNKLVTNKHAREILEVKELSILNDRINELANILWRHEGMDKAELNVRITRAIEHYSSLKPSDGAEGMLA